MWNQLGKLKISCTSLSKSVRNSWANFTQAETKQNTDGKYERVMRQWSISSQHTSPITCTAAPRLLHFSAFHSYQAWCYLLVTTVSTYEWRCFFVERVRNIPMEKFRDKAGIRTQHLNTLLLLLSHSLRVGLSLVPRPFVGETAWQLTRVQTVYGYDVKEITAPPVQAMNIG